MWEKLLEKPITEICAALCAVSGSFVLLSNDVHNKQVKKGARPLV
jgi:hypothetical protein